MLERYRIVFGKTLIELTEFLNDPDNGYSRLVYMEKNRSGYTALLDTYALVVATLDDIREPTIDTELELIPLALSA